MATRPEETPHTAEAIRILDKMVPQADGFRADRLESLGRMRVAKAAALERERARLTDKYGASSPPVQAITDQIVTNQALTAHIAAETLRARTAGPDADPKAWILHGRVSDSQLNPMPDLTIALYDANNRWVESLGFACTDSTGYFKLTHPLKSVVATEAPSTAAAPGSSSGSRTGDEQAAPVFVHVLDSKSATLDADTRELSPTANRIDYIEILLGDAKPSDCGSPSGKPRKPPKSRKSAA